MLRHYNTILFVFAALSAVCGAQEAETSFSTVYSFQAGTGDAFEPDAGIVAGIDTSMIGVSMAGGSANQGAVFLLVPPTRKTNPWFEKVLYSFPGGREGFAPVGPLAIERPNLFGVASGGSEMCGLSGSLSCGLVFELRTPGTHGEPWRESVIYSFGPQGTYGWSPSGALTPGPNGVLYGATQHGPGAPTEPCANGCGTLFSLTPPDTEGDPWTFNILYSFQGQKDGAYPLSPLVLSADGTLYGTSLGGDPGCSGGCGTVYSLTPPIDPGGAWTHTVLHLFSESMPAGGLSPGAVVLGKGGILYGTSGSGGSENSGIVFALRPPSSAGGAWVEKVLYSFTNAADGAAPFSGLAIGARGAIYGTTSRGGDMNCLQSPNVGCGTVYQLKPPLTPGAGWTFATLHAFTGGTDGGPAAPGLLISSDGVLFGATSSGGANGMGTVFQVIPRPSRHIAP